MILAKEHSRDGFLNIQAKKYVFSTTALAFNKPFQEAEVLRKSQPSFKYFPARGSTLA